MAKESDTWIMHGVAEDDAGCIHTVEEAISYINEIGFLPLFRNEIPGFSLEERTVPEYWWSDDALRDPWQWRKIIARSGKAAYGRFFAGKAGFISLTWLPYFANYRRDGYDFDALWDDEKASIRQKKIMDLFEEEYELYSFEVKQKAGFGKGGEKNFEGTITWLQMQTYLCIRDFRQKKNKAGREYGMDVAVYSRPEHVWGYESVTSAYSEEPPESGKRIVRQLMDRYPDATAEQIQKVVGVGPGEEPRKKKTKKSVNYPASLLKALQLDMEALTADQMRGLEFVIGQLKESIQNVVRLHYEQGMTLAQIGEQIGRSGSRCGQLNKIALRKLRNPKCICWITEGYQGRMDSIGKLVAEEKKELIADGKPEQAELLDQSPEALPDITANDAETLMKAGVYSLGVLRTALKEDFWTRAFPGIGIQNGKRIVNAMLKTGLIDESFESYKEASDPMYGMEKRRIMHEKRWKENKSEKL